MSGEEVPDRSRRSEAFSNFSRALDRVASLPDFDGYAASLALALLIERMRPQLDGLAEKEQVDPYTFAEGIVDGDESSNLLQTILH